MKKLALCCLAALGLLAVAPSHSFATFVFTAAQVGNDVVINGSGTLNTAALTLDTANYPGQGSVLVPTVSLVAIDPGSVNLLQYTGVNYPNNFGGGGLTKPDTDAGDAVVIAGDYLYVPLGYTSGTALSDTMTFANATFASLGFAPGTYTFTWGSGANADSLIITTAVPEPSTWALLGLGVVGAGVVVLRRRQARA